MQIGTPGAAYGPGFSVRRPVLGQGQPYGPRSGNASQRPGVQARPMPYRPIRPSRPDFAGVAQGEMQRRLAALRQSREARQPTNQKAPGQALMLARVAAQARQFQAPLMGPIMTNYGG